MAPPKRQMAPVPMKTAGVNPRNFETEPDSATQSTIMSRVDDLIERASIVANKTANIRARMFGNLAADGSDDASPVPSTLEDKLCWLRDIVCATEATVQILDERLS